MESPARLARLLLWGGVGCGAIAWFLLAFVVFGFHTYYMPAASMSPTFERRDVILVSKIAYAGSAPRDGDVVTFDVPIEATNRFIKRIIGGPGETLRIHRGVVFRNGAALREPYIAEETNYDLEIKNYGIYVDGTPLDTTEANVPPKNRWTSPDTIPAGCYFMLGDNRNNSEDSHVWGFAQRAGTFYSGVEAGHQAREFERAIFIVSPASRARGL